MSAIVISRARYARDRTGVCTGLCKQEHPAGVITPLRVIDNVRARTCERERARATHAHRVVSLMSIRCLGPAKGLSTHVVMVHVSKIRFPEVHTRIPIVSQRPSNTRIQYAASSIQIALILSQSLIEDSRTDRPVIAM